MGEALLLMAAVRILCYFGCEGKIGIAFLALSFPSEHTSTSVAIACVAAECSSICIPGTQVEGTFSEDKLYVDYTMEVTQDIVNDLGECTRLLSNIFFQGKHDTCVYSGEFHVLDC
mgnify:CR=1 FL=1